MGVWSFQGVLRGAVRILDPQLLMQTYLCLRLHTQHTGMVVTSMEQVAMVQGCAGRPGGGALPCGALQNCGVLEPHAACSRQGLRNPLPVLLTGSVHMP